MRRLRSARGDRGLLAALWLLALAVVAVGAALGVVVLLLWGALGVVVAAFATYVVVRDSRAPARPVEEDSL